MVLLCWIHCMKGAIERKFFCVFVCFFCRKMQGDLKAFSFVDNRFVLFGLSQLTSHVGNMETLIKLGGDYKWTTNESHVMWSTSCMMLPRKPGESLSARRNQEKDEKEMMSNEVGKIEMGKLNKQQEPSSRDAVKVLENLKPHWSLQMQKAKAHMSPGSLQTITLCVSLQSLVMDAGDAKHTAYFQMLQTPVIANS